MTEISYNPLLKPVNMMISWTIIIFLYIVSPMYQGYDIVVNNYFQINWAGKISGKGFSVLYDENSNGVVEKWPITIYVTILAIFFICSFLAGLYWNEFSKEQVTIKLLDLSFYLQLISILLIIISSVYVANYEAEYRPTLLGTIIWLFCLMQLYMMYSVKEYWNDRKKQLKEGEKEKLTER